MGERRKVICPSCKAILEMEYVPELENKKLRCPKCGGIKTFSAYIPFPAYEDETELGKVLHFGPAGLPGQQSPMDDSTDFVRQPISIQIGSLIVPGVDEPVQLQMGRNIIGRAASTSKATIQIRDSTRTMSREHYYIDVIQQSGNVSHLLSIAPNTVNATELNGVKLDKADKLVLHDGNKIRSGKVEVKFVIKKIE